MDLEECVQVSVMLYHGSSLWYFFCHRSVLVISLFAQITDGTLIQLSIYCPRLQVLVNVALASFC